MNGYLPENQQALNFTINGINWKNGEQLLLRWDDADESGSDDACGIDQFSFSAKQVVMAPSIADLQIKQFTDRSVIISSSIYDNNANTGVQIEYDTTTNFLTPKLISPQPANIPSGAGKTSISANIASLAPGKIYYYRIKATNAAGTVTSTSGNFTVPIELAEINSIIAGPFTPNSATLKCSLLGDGGSAITEKGFVWSTSNTPTITSNKIIAGAGLDAFSQTISGLSSCSTYYARAYAINQAGISYSSIIQISTPTTIIGLTPTLTGTTNAITVVFSGKTAQTVTGLTIANFRLLTEGIDSCFISAINLSANGFSVIVNTGSNDGSIQLQLDNDKLVTPAISNLPFISPSRLIIDKTPPIIHSVSIFNKLMKVGDTVLVNISVKPDSALLKLQTGFINEFPIFGLYKKNDSSYSAYFIVAQGGIDVPADADIPVKLMLTDPAGNKSLLYQQTIYQADDKLDANKPMISYIRAPKKGIYKTGDSLMFIIKFSEIVNITGNALLPYLKITVGNSSKQAMYTKGSGTDSLQFMYIIQSGDLDTNGIQCSNTITLNNSFIKDGAGNTAILTIQGTIENNVIVDGVAPKINAILLPIDKLYAINDTLQFVVNFSENIIWQNKLDTPILKISVGNTQKNLLFSGKNNGQDLFFRYAVQKNDLDKKGVLPLTLITFMTTTLTDFVGNPAILTFKTTGLTSAVKVDAQAPAFIVGDTLIHFCTSDSLLLLTDYIQAIDEEKGESITWQIYSRNNPKGLTKNSFTAIATGAKQVPGLVQYLPDLSNYQSDTLEILLSDGINLSKKIIYLQADPPIQQNKIETTPIACSGNIPAKIIGTQPNGGNGKFTYQWETAGTIDSNAFTKINNGNTKDFNPPRLSTNTWYRRKVISGSCTVVSDPIKIIVLKTGLWQGQVSNDWHSAANWCNAVLPDKQTDVWIPPTNNQPFIKDSALCKDLFLFPTVKLLITGSLELTGDMYTDHESLLCSKGRIIYSGAKKQNIISTFFDKKRINDLVINNAAGVDLGDSLSLSGILQLYNGVLNTNHQLLIRHNGKIGPASDETGIEGEIILEHILEAGKKRFRLLGHPFSNDKGLHILKDSMVITGKNGWENGFTASEENQPSAFWYNPLQANDLLPFDANWQAFTHTNGQEENAWKRYAGIRLFLQGNADKGLEIINNVNPQINSYITKPVTISCKGFVNMGDNEIKLIKGAMSGYQVIGNPYVNKINLSKITRGKGVGKYYWIWNEKQGLTGGYTALSFENNFTLPVFGAFIVKAVKDSNNSLLITENSKTNASQTDELPSMKGLVDYQIELRLIADSIFWDRLILLHSDSAKSWFETADAEKLFNSQVNIYSLSKDQKKLAIDSRPFLNETMVNIGIDSDEPRKFKLLFKEVDLPENYRLLLFDRFLNTSISVVKDSSYHFETTLDTGSYGNHRFVLKKWEPVKQNKEEKLSVSLHPIPASNELYITYASNIKGATTIKLIDQQGKLIKWLSLGEQDMGKAKISISDLIPGLYFVEIKVGDSSSLLKMIKL